MTIHKTTTALMLLTSLGCSLLLPIVTHAAPNGPYLGLQLGQSHSDYSASSEDVDTPILGPATIDKKDPSGFGGRLYAGYQFNRYLASELGYIMFNTVKIDNIFGIPNANETIKPRAGDLVAKIMVPFAEKFDIYARLGAAYLYVTRNYNSPATIVEPNSSNSHKFRATYGIGADYQISPTLSTDLSWMQVQGGAGFSSSRLMALGLAYHFG